ncbi:MAG: DUF2283 domain-containing protein [Candidatus Kapabacteria bacterium]|jgi:uncharacterized protein YuzE|nr:DUF2283 domain-containing protein [Candidatus Kapabacteria bacterium]
MEFSHDPEANAAYLRLCDDIALQGECETVRVESGTGYIHCDFLPDGRLYGIEFMDARRQVNVDTLSEIIHRTNSVFA